MTLPLLIWAGCVRPGTASGAAFDRRDRRAGLHHAAGSLATCASLSNEPFASVAFLVIGR